jgi:hypothetical protein
MFGRPTRPGAPRWAVSLALVLLPASSAFAQRTGFDFAGHVKYQLLGSAYPEDSLFREQTGDSAWEHNLELRLGFGFRRGGWDLKADYQAIAYHGDSIEYSRELPRDLELLYGRLPEDDRRLFDLTHVMEDEGRFAALQRLDRAWLGYTAERGVVRLGRQAISWGNGLVYTPMDTFNPFDPAAVDKEYKSGDDMVYGQYLRGNGHDLQGVAVFRRRLSSGDVRGDESSFALKYHGLSGGTEFDVLAGQHFGEALLGLGGSQSIGGAVWRGDLVVTLGEEETVASAVTSVSYSWTWGGKNVSGLLEYFFSGFGLPGRQLDLETLADEPALLDRLARGELFTLGRHYVVASTLTEVHPLFTLTPNVFANLSDRSALVQVVGQNDFRENVVLQGALSLPIGARGTEFGGIGTDVPDRYLSSGPGLFFQLAWYF